MSELLVVTALRTEYAALAGQVPGALVERCGMGMKRVQAWVPRIAALAPDAVVVAGVGGGVEPGAAGRRRRRGERGPRRRRAYRPARCRAAGGRVTPAGPASAHRADG